MGRKRYEKWLQIRSYIQARHKLAISARNKEFVIYMAIMKYRIAQLRCGYLSLNLEWSRWKTSDSVDDQNQQPLKECGINKGFNRKRCSFNYT